MLMCCVIQRILGVENGTAVVKPDKIGFNRKMAVPVVEIVEFSAEDPSHASAFKELNEAWITTLFRIEDKDREVLQRPQEKILDKGGRIFIATVRSEVVGCAALVRMDDEGASLEVAKMTVKEGCRGLGIGKKMMERCIVEGKKMGAKRLYLESNKTLDAAMALYKSTGFVDLPFNPDTPYARADVFMERPLID